MHGSEPLNAELVAAGGPLYTRRIPGTHAVHSFCGSGDGNGGGDARRARRRRNMRKLGKLVLILAVLISASAAWGQSAMPAAGKTLTIGLVLVGPYNDQGWSQAHYDAVQYVTGKVAGTKMVYIDKANPADRPGTTVSQLGESLVAKGAKLLIFSSDDMADEAVVRHGAS
jgi:hypothetical protein